MIMCGAGALWGRATQLQLPNTNAEWKATMDGYLKTIAANPAKKPSFVLAIIPNADEHKYSMVCAPHPHSSSLTHRLLVRLN